MFGIVLIEKNSVPKSNTKKKKVVIELLFFQDPGNYCVVFTIVRCLISQGAFL